MKRERFVIIDGSGLMLRAYHRKGPSRRSPSGKDTRAVHSYCMDLFPLIRELKPDYLVMALDVPRSATFRRKLDPQYKAHRDGVVKSGGQLDQVAWMEQLTVKLGIPTLRVDEFEADDVIASLVGLCGGDDVECIVVSSDHDLQQLAGEHCRVYDPFKDVWFDSAAVRARWGVEPEQVVEVMTLMGDKGDNVTGVPDVGPVTATKVIKKYGTVNNAVAHAAEWANTAIQMALATTDLKLCRQLVELRNDVPLSISAEWLEFNGLNMEDAAPTMLRLGLRSTY